MNRSTDTTLYPSVTEILSRMGVTDDFRDVPKDKLEYARQRGKAVHHAIALDVEGRLDETSLDPALGGRIEAWRKFKRDWNWTPLRWEMELACHRIKVKGHPDQVGEWEGHGVWLIDFKNTALFDEPGVGLQLGGYEELLEEDCGWRLDGRAGVQLRENGDPRIYMVPAKLAYANRVSFLNFAASFHWLLNNGRLRDNGGAR